MFEEEGNLIEHDNNVEVLEIRIPKIYEGIDLSLLDLNFILRLCLNKQLQEIIMSKKVEDGEIVLSTKLTDKHLYSNGMLYISLCIYNEEIRLNTEIARLYVKKTLTAEEVYSVGVVEEYLEQMRRMVDLINVEQIKTDVINSITADDLKIIEQYNGFMGFPSVGRDGVVYVDLTENEQYIWTGEKYECIGSDWKKIELIDGRK